MSVRAKEHSGIEDQIRDERREDGAGAERDGHYGAAYRQARAHVLEASLRGLVRLRVAV